MEIRYFQIIIPILSLILIVKQVLAYTKAKSSFYETALILVFWIGLTMVAIIPDLISDTIAKIFGIKDNVNAILFFAIGVLIYIQLQFYKALRKQDDKLTELARKIALKNPEEKEQ